MKRFNSLVLLSSILAMLSCSGDNGTNGINGIDGIDGANGANGSPGTNGTKGIDGEDGLNGQDGIDGESKPIFLKQISSYASGVFDESAAEIVAYDTLNQRLFVVNANIGALDVLDISNPNVPTLIGTINAANDWIDAGKINGVDVSNGLVAAGVQNDNDTGNGKLMLYDASNLAFLGDADVGNLPDSVAFTPNGNKVIVANEGEPISDYSIDPEGSISIVNVSIPSAPLATHITFNHLNAQRADLIDQGVRIFGNAGRSAYSVTAVNNVNPAEITVSDASGIVVGDIFTLSSSEGDPINYRVAGIAGNVLTLHDEFDGDSKIADTLLVDGVGGFMVYLHDGASTVAEDLEPEFVAVSPDGETAVVSLQENNAIAVININTMSLEKILPLGTKNHMLIGNELDVSDKDEMVNIRNWPVYGMYLPDSIAVYEQGGQKYYVTANEGDAREYDAYVEEIRFKDAGASGIVDLEGNIFTNPLWDFSDGNHLGRITSTLTGDTDGNGSLDMPYVFGGRSFTIWSEAGVPVYDSGSDFALITASMFGFNFNNNNDKNDGDGRSDAKGSEPEAVTLGQIAGRTYAFIGLERMGGIMVYDITNPYNPGYIQYVNNRDFSYDFAIDPENGEAGDLGPEGLKFIPAEQSPNGMNLLVVANEVSGTTTIYQIEL